MTYGQAFTYVRLYVHLLEITYVHLLGDGLCTLTMYLTYHDIFIYITKLYLKYLRKHLIPQRILQ